MSGAGGDHRYEYLHTANTVIAQSHQTLAFRGENLDTSAVGVGCWLSLRRNHLVAV